MHPARPGGPPTLLDGLHALLAFEIVNGARLSIINRLDRETSGVVLIAKHPAAARAFGIAVMRRHVAKEYLAITWSWPTEDRFVIDAPMLRQGAVTDSPIHLKQMIHPHGAPCRTGFDVIKRFQKETTAGNRFAIVRARPQTGRMHQIRVHLAHAGHPIVATKSTGRRNGRISISSKPAGPIRSHEASSSVATPCTPNVSPFKPSHSAGTNGPHLSPTTSQGLCD